MGFNVAARLAEVAARRPFEELVRAELLEPLGMRDTALCRVRRPGAPGQPHAPGRREPVHRGRRRTDLDPRRLCRVLPDAPQRRDLPRPPHPLKQAVAAMRARQGKLELLMSGPYGKDYGLAFFLEPARRPGRSHVVSSPATSAQLPGSMRTASWSVSCWSSPTSCESSRSWARMQGPRDSSSPSRPA